LNSLRGESRVKRWVYLSILVAVALALAVGGWIVEGLRAPFRASRPLPKVA
jgi:hypothetical protein